MGRLAGGVAHDFNNLLTIAKGHGDLLLEGLQAADPFYRSSQQISKAADRAASLTGQLLAFSRMQVLQPKVLDLNALVADMIKLLTRLIREDIAFTFRPGGSLSPVKADPSQIEQVFSKPQGIGPQAETLGERVQRTAPSFGAQRQDASRASSRTRSPLPNCQESLLTNTRLSPNAPLFSVCFHLSSVPSV